MRLEPAHGIEAGALATAMDIVIAARARPGREGVYFSPMSLGTALPSCGRPMAW